MQAISFLNLKPLTSDLLPAVVELDKACFGGLWTLEGYRRELHSPNSDVLVLLPDSDNLRQSGVQSERVDDIQKISPRPPVPASPHQYTPGSGSPPPSIFGLGCLWAILDEAHITIVAVHPDYRRQGFGQVLLLFLLSLAKQRELKRATLEVRVSNQAGLSLYEKFGFQVAGRRRGYYQDTDEDALILWLGGIQHPEFEKKIANWERQTRDRLACYGWDLNSTLLKN